MAVSGEIAFSGGTVYPVQPGTPPAEALLVRGERIAALGTVAEVRAAASPAAEMVDLAGRVVLPGFQDAHVHPCLAGPELNRCNLVGSDRRDDYLATVATYAAANPAAPWLVGKGWAMSAFPGGIAPAIDLDAVVPDRPVLLMNRDGHGAWVNSVALARAGIDRDTPDPSDGRIERTADGAPVGTLQEGAAELVRRLIPPLTTEEVGAGILAAQRYLFSRGITSWQDAWVEAPGHHAYTALATKGELRGRVVGCLWWDRERGLEQVDDLLAMRGHGGTGRYRPTTVKMMLDGVCENHTASLLDPYLDGTGAVTANRGLSFVDADTVLAAAPRLDRAGFQVHFHAIGDAAVRLALDAVEAARVANGPGDRRHHLAHLQLVHPDDRPRFARLGAVANAQPLWAHHDSYQDELTIPFIGEQRSALQYPWRSLLDEGARLAIGSDWDVSTPDPFKILHVAVERLHPKASDRPFHPAQRITLTEAVEAYTLGSAYVNHRDHDTGSLVEGKMADLVMVDRDPFTEGPWGCQIDLTMIGGEVVHQA
ncbi:MAG: amidohydrolase [Acidimicrobiia bacterium]|nr:amidohydrolase [Acidimicrobiia bacterium]